MQRKPRRVVFRDEQLGRGCLYCNDARYVSVKYAEDNLHATFHNEREAFERTLACPFDRCPYRELDGIKDYLKDYDAPIARKMKGII